jgi:hypothetical protein
MSKTDIKLTNFRNELIFTNRVLVVMNMINVFFFQLPLMHRHLMFFTILIGKEKLIKQTRNTFSNTTLHIQS